MECLLPQSAHDDEDIYEIYLFCYARAWPFRVHDHFAFRDMHDGPMPLDFNFWLLRNKHRNVLVDTGFRPSIASVFNRTLDYDPMDGLRRVGLDPNEIEDVIITHFHGDHAGNVGNFPNARIHVQEAEAAYVTGRCMCEPYVRFGVDVEDVISLVRTTFEARTRFHDGDAQIWPGIWVHLMPGHTHGMQSVSVMTKRGLVLLAADVSHFYANLLLRKPFVITDSVSQTFRSYDKLMQLGGTIEQIVPGHDPKVRQLYPSINVAGVDLVALHEVPKAHDIAELSRLDDFTFERPELGEGGHSH